MVDVSEGVDFEVDEPGLFGTGGLVNSNCISPGLSVIFSLFVKVVYLEGTITTLPDDVSDFFTGGSFFEAEDVLVVDLLLAELLTVGAVRSFLLETSEVGFEIVGSLALLQPALILGVSVNPTNSLRNVGVFIY